MGRPLWRCRSHGHGLAVPPAAWRITNGSAQIGVDVIDVPADDNPSPAIVAFHTRNTVTVDDDAELMLAIADPKLDIARPFVGLHTRKLCVQFPRLNVVGREEADRAQSA